MNSFDKAREVEKISTSIVVPFLTGLGMTFTPIVGFDQQVTYGDFVVTGPNDTFYWAELKAERMHTENLFLETYSNRRAGRKGWMDHLQSHVLLYHFLDRNVMYAFRLPHLQNWFKVAAPKYREVPQRRHEQNNDTWGRIVPIKDIPYTALMSEWDISKRACIYYS